MYSDFYHFICTRLGFDAPVGSDETSQLLDAGKQLPSIRMMIGADGTLGQTSIVYAANSVRRAANKGELTGRFAAEALRASRFRGSDDILGIQSAKGEAPDYVCVYPCSANWREELVGGRTPEALESVTAVLGGWNGTTQAILDRLPESFILAQMDIPLQGRQPAKMHIRPVCIPTRGFDVPVTGASELLDRLGLDGQADAVRDWLARHPQADAAHCWEVVLRVSQTGKIESEILLSVIARNNPHITRNLVKPQFESPKQARFSELVADTLSSQQREEVSRAGDGFNMPYVDSAFDFKNLRIYAKLAALDISFGPDGARQAAAQLLFTPHLIEGAAGYIANISAVQWHITDVCDQRCKHCYIFAEDSGISLTTMPYEKLLSTLDELDDMFDRAGRFFRPVITGGDPILHPQFWDFMGELHDRGLKFTILGNPFHLSPEVCDRLCALGCVDYQVSMDGLEEFHDSLRKPGSFRETLRAIRCLQESGVSPVVMLTVSNANIDQVEDVANLCVKLHVARFGFARYCPTSKENADELHIEPERYRRFLYQMIDLYNGHRGRDCFTRLAEKEHLFTLAHYERGEFKVPSRAKSGVVYDGCHCGQGFCILPNGDIMACRRMESVLGNLNDSSILEIRQGSATNEWRDASGLEKCSKCELFGWCRGCQAVGAGYTGNRLSPDPQCWKQVE